MLLCVNIQACLFAPTPTDIHQDMRPRSNSVDVDVDVVDVDVELYRTLDRKSTRLNSSH